MLTATIYELDRDEATRLARVLVAARGSIPKLMRDQPYTFDHKPHPGLYRISCCFVCLKAAWRSTSKADVDDWEIDDITPFDICSLCESNLSSMGPFERQAMEDMAAGHMVTLGRTLVRLNHYKPNPETALDLIRAAATRP